VSMWDAVYTIGHSTHSIEGLVKLLKRHSITAVADVRSRPYSRVNPQFNRESLKQELLVAGMKYVFLGKELGARSDDKNCYRNGQVQYDLLAKTELFRRGIERIKEGMLSYRIAVMCAEKEPLECHRTILVSRSLRECDIPVKHILSDGRIEEHEITIQRLVVKLGISEHDMFRTADETISEAYKRQADEIAYREQTDQFVQGVAE
jgi:uncharacterized protein (DUF488 family)